MKRIILTASLCLLPLVSLADCMNSIRPSELLAALVELNASYGDVRSSIDCFSTSTPAQSMICNNDILEAMELVDTKAHVYAIENATGSELEHLDANGNSPFDEAWAKETRDKCTTEECLCLAFKEHTKPSMDVYAD